MNEILKHKGYLGSTELDLENEYLYGEVLFINDKIIYNGSTIEELKTAFKSAVDDYLAFCQEIGKTPDVSCSGTFNVRISPELHATCVKQARLSNLTLNAFVSEALKQACTNNTSLRSINRKIIELSERLDYHFSYEKINVSKEEMYPLNQSLSTYATNIGMYS